MDRRHGLRRNLGHRVLRRAAVAFASTEGPSGGELAMLEREGAKYARKQNEDSAEFMKLLAPYIVAGGPDAIKSVAAVFVGYLRYTSTQIEAVRADPIGVLQGVLGTFLPDPAQQHFMAAVVHEVAKTLVPWTPDPVVIASQVPKDKLS